MESIIEQSCGIENPNDYICRGINMKSKEFKTLLIEDDAYKAADIRKALEYCGIKDIERAWNQAAGFDIIYKNIEQGTPVELIVTDMSYPLEAHEPDDKEAGFKLIERMKKEELDIPVIICSAQNYNEPGILGSICYNDLQDINQEFKAVIDKMQ